MEGREFHKELMKTGAGDKITQDTFGRTGTRSSSFPFPLQHN